MDYLTKAWTDWEQVTNVPPRQTRCSLQRLIGYQYEASDTHTVIMTRDERMGVTINISEGGLCLLMDRAPTVRDVPRLLMLGSDGTPREARSAEVRWVRPLPVGQEDVHVVGVKFLLIGRSAESGVASIWT